VLDRENKTWHGSTGKKPRTFVVNGARVVISVIPESYVAWQKKSIFFSLPPCSTTSTESKNETAVFLIPSHPSLFHSIFYRLALRPLEPEKEGGKDRRKKTEK